MDTVELQTQCGFRSNPMLPIIAMCLWICLWISSVISILVGNWVAVTPLLVLSLIVSYLLFRNTLNTVQVAGRVYWIVRDLVPKGTRRFSRAFMRETESPWRTGKGIQLRVSNKTIQVGICDKGRPGDDLDGLVYAMQGRLLVDSPHVIGNWGNETVQEEFDTV